MGLAAVSWAFVPPYQVPNPNKKLCYEPSDAVLYCGQLQAATDCASRTEYVIPDGTVASQDPANTTQTLADCWRSRPCRWVEEPPPGHCEAVGEFDEWHLRAKYVEMPPPPGEE